MYITGGIHEKMVYSKKTYEIFFFLEDGRLEAISSELPSLNEPRKDHSSFIYKDYLFVIFGIIKDV